MFQSTLARERATIFGHHEVYAAFQSTLARERATYVPSREITLR